MKRISLLAAAAVAAVAASGLPALAGGMTQPAPEPAVAPPPAPMPAPAIDWTGAYGSLGLGYGHASVSGGVSGGNGGVGSLALGYNRDFGNYVLGGELSYTKANIGFAGGAGKGKDATALKLRAGYKLGNARLYGTAGMARGHGTYSGTSYGDTGAVVGLGVDYALNDKWMVGTEADFYRFDNVAGSSVDVHPTTISALVGFRF